MSYYVIEKHADGSEYSTQFTEQAHAEAYEKHLQAQPGIESVKITGIKERDNG